MARRAAADTRERILVTAARLFGDKGVHAVGLQQIIEAAGCGKNLLYREFPSKDVLVTAYLERCREDWTETLRETAAATNTPAEQIVAVVKAIAERATAPGTRGCALRNTFAEFPEQSHPAHQVAVEHFTQMRRQLHELAQRADAHDPQLLGDRIMLIIDGLYTNGAIFGTAGAAAAAIAFAEEVVAAQTTTSTVVA
ncbi:TetR/AcrR family transcriptional regulator [Sphaerimonospora thailandensis]|uniref:TetR family transcriptional regulator n=1 Tax=Sphaerimonospora thailandensis TaxID=795644 RepID=A0A8J3W0Q8_9ACTN|nr:TetR/AcrR family transcriptional regulator [Sphaerimonospora thailandensis]GIH72484.1 TetR family transcriptional regulator [Sphaerimonospora thailandensis]